MNGIDIALPKRHAGAGNGQWEVANFSNSNLEAGFGNYIEIDHGNGMLHPLFTP